MLVKLNAAIKTAKHDLRVVMGKHLKPGELDRAIRILNQIWELATVDLDAMKALCRVLSDDFEGIYWRLRGPYKNGPNAEHAGSMYRISGEFFKVYLDCTGQAR